MHEEPGWLTTDEEATLDEIIGNADSIGETFAVGTTMAFYADALEAEQHRAVIAARISALSGVNTVRGGAGTVAG